MNTAHNNARFTAIATLTKLHQGNTALKPLFDAASRHCDLSQADRSLAMKLVYGALRERQYLDLLVEKLSHTPQKKLAPPIRFALHIGLYQLFFLDRIPQSAAVNETVKAVKALGKPKPLQGMVNGILRESLRRKTTLPRPNATIAEGHPNNHPQWMTQRWKKQFGEEETCRICSINNQEPLLSLRTNTTVLTRNELQALFLEHNITACKAPYAPEGLILPDYQGPITVLPGYQKGYFQPQDQATQLATHLLGPFDDNTSYLDGCAGLGTKTCHLLQLTTGQNATITALEPMPHRQRLFQRNIKKYPSQNRPQFYPITLQDYCQNNTQSFDRVLLDVPCSGSGVIRRHPDIRWNRKPEDFSIYQRHQLDILHHGAQLVAPQGILVYATCSIEHEENRDVITTFLKKTKDFELTDCTDFLPRPSWNFIYNKCFSPRPEQDIDGFFAARLQRISST